MRRDYVMTRRCRRHDFRERQPRRYTLSSPPAAAVASMPLAPCFAISPRFAMPPRGVRSTIAPGCYAAATAGVIAAGACRFRQNGGIFTPFTDDAIAAFSR